MAKSLRMSEEQYAAHAARHRRAKADTEAVLMHSGGAASSAPLQRSAAATPSVDGSGASGSSLPLFAAADHPITPDAAAMPQWAAAKGRRKLNLLLPMPPSVNELYSLNRSTGAKFLQPKQRDFRRDVMQIVHATRKGALPLSGRLEMRVTLYDKGSRKWDVDGRLKALLDGLQHGGAYFNDHQVDVLHVERIVRRGEDEACAVVLREIAA